MKPISDSYRQLRGAARGYYYDLMMRSPVGARFDGYAFAYNLRALFERLAIDCVLDVGANKGQYRNFLRESVGYQGHIVSFEPTAANAAILRDRSTADPRWIVYDVGLGLTEEEVAIHVPRDSKLASILTPMPATGAHDHDETIRVTTLAKVLPELEARIGPRRVFLKSDTQGYDLQVMKGARRHLDAILAVQTEASFQPLYEGAPHFLDMFTFLTEQGFLPIGFFPVDRDDGGRMIECDLVMAR